MAYVYNPATRLQEWVPDYMMQQPISQQPQQQTQQEERLVLVSDEMEARAVRVPYNDDLWMMDKGKSRIYAKSVDASGTSTFKIFELVEVQQPAPSDYALRSDLDKLASVVGQLAGAVNAIISPQQPTQTQNPPQEVNGNG